MNLNSLVNLAREHIPSLLKYLLLVLFILLAGSSVEGNCFNPGDLICPPDYNGMAGSQDVLACTDDYPTDINGHPDPIYTGNPELEDFDVNGNCLFYCVYSDDSISICEGSYIIVRNWDCYDWCKGGSYNCQQTIKVMDNEAPLITCPDDITLYADNNCQASTILPVPALFDVCSPSEGYYNVSVTAGVLTNSGNDWILSNLLMGTTTVRYIGFDGCGNSDTCYFEITVADLSPPIAICESIHTIAIPGSPTYINALVFDNGSVDNCSSLTYEVRRLINSDCTAPDGLETEFAESVPFYCCDAGDTIEVILRLTDANGLSNTCSGLVIIQDHIGPSHFNCPSDITVDCTIDIDDFSNTGGEPEFFDDCGIDTLIISNDSTLNNCGSGTIIRKWFAFDFDGNIDSCEQVIIIENNNAFTITDTECWAVPAGVGHSLIDGVEWPCDLILTTCGMSLHPDSLENIPGVDPNDARPRIFPNACGDMIAITFTDLYLNNPAICEKLLRTWYVYDWCAADPSEPVSTYTQLIMIIDSEPPVITDPIDCENIPVTVVPLSISANDNCTEEEDLIYSYVITLAGGGILEGNTDTILLSIPNGQHTITWTVEDLCENTTTCTYILGGGTPPDYAILSGNILNEEDSEIEHVLVDLEGDGMSDELMTTGVGHFSFTVPTNNNYSIIPERNDHLLNGVSTLDLVLINKHILQSELLSTPYKIIAADVNNSGQVSAIDMVELRKVILFIETEFPDNDSWRFVDAAFVFPNPTNPFGTPFPEVYTVNGLTQDEIADFVGVKIGDVNCSSVPNDLIGSSDDRNNEEPLLLAVNDQQLTAGESYIIDFNVVDFNAVQGFQFTMNFDANALELDDIQAARLKDLSDANFGTHLLDEGAITASWNSNQNAETLDKGETAFSITFTAKVDGQLSDLISICSRFTKAEAYKQNGASDLSLVFFTQNGVIVNNQFELFQNRPNPFKDQTVIGFNLPVAGKATMTIYDISGRVIQMIEGDFAKGYNEIGLNRNELQSTGVLYYQLESANSIASKKMALMN